MSNKYIMVTYRKKSLVARLCIGGGYEVVAECDNEYTAQKIVKGLNGNG